MSKINNKTLILKQIKLYYGFKKDSDFAAFLGISPQTLSSWYSRNMFDMEIVYSKCSEIEAEFLITGKGSISKKDKEQQASALPSKSVDLNEIVTLQQMLIEEMQRNRLLEQQIENKPSNEVFNKLEELKKHIEELSAAYKSINIKKTS